MWKHCKQNTGPGTVKLILSPIKSMHFLRAVMKRKNITLHAKFKKYEKKNL